MVATDESRGNAETIYDPPGIRSMAHHSYLSPDGKWVLIVAMDSQGRFAPCRVVPFRGGATKTVGPTGHACLASAWSNDGKWVYLNIYTDTFHIWRQPFPEGEPEQVTNGPTSQEGIAMDPDGHSLITSVGSQDRTVWVHDSTHERQISSEGAAYAPAFSRDGKRIYYIMTKGLLDEAELWVKNLETDVADRVFPGYPIDAFSVSADGTRIVFTMTDRDGHIGLWMGDTSHLQAPRRLSDANVIEDSPFFLPDNEIIFRSYEGTTPYLCHMDADGGHRRKLSNQRVLEVNGISRDGLWITALVAGPNPDHAAYIKALATDGSEAITVCDGYCYLTWDQAGPFAYLSLAEDGDEAPTYVLPLGEGSRLPKLVEGGVFQASDIPRGSRIREIPVNVRSAVNGTKYAYERTSTRRNLFRVPLP